MLVTVGNMIIMPCGVSTEKIVTVEYQWTKDGSQVIVDNNRVKLSNGDLNITNFMDSDRGKYECFARLSVNGINAPPIIWSVGSAFYTESKRLTSLVPAVLYIS